MYIPAAIVEPSLAALIILGLLLVGGLVLFLVGYVLSGGKRQRDPKPLYQAAGALLAATTLAASTFFAAEQANESTTEAVKGDVEAVKGDVTEEIRQGNEQVQETIEENK